MHCEVIIAIISEMKRHYFTSTLYLAGQPSHRLAYVFVERVCAQEFHYPSALEHSAWFRTQMGNKHAYPTAL